MTGIALRFLALAAMASGLCGCGLGPKPWEKDLMAQREMAPVTHPLLSAAEDHVYFSKEGSSGGRGFAGGGCGCN